MEFSFQNIIKSVLIKTQWGLGGFNKNIDVNFNISGDSINDIEEEMTTAFKCLSFALFKQKITYKH